MKLLTKAILAKLPPLGSQDGKGLDAIAQVKFFNPTGIGTWYATEFDPQTGMFFGLADIHEKELGYFSLEELSSFRGRFGLKIERDLYFKPVPLKELYNVSRSAA